jgi:hypothetical protein
MAVWAPTGGPVSTAGRTDADPPLPRAAVGRPVREPAQPGPPRPAAEKPAAGATA